MVTYSKWQNYTLTKLHGRWCVVMLTETCSVLVMVLYVGAHIFVGVRLHRQFLSTVEYCREF